RDRSTLNLWNVRRLGLLFSNRDVFQPRLLQNRAAPSAMREGFRKGRRRLLIYFVCSFSFVRSSAVETFLIDNFACVKPLDCARADIFIYRFYSLHLARFQKPCRYISCLPYKKTYKEAFGNTLQVNLRLLSIFPKTETHPQNCYKVGQGRRGLHPARANH